MAGGPRTGEDRIFTVPNGITALRLACLPLFVWLLVRDGRSGWFAAAVLLGVLGATDGVDGYVARHFRQVSAAGKVLDPLADRLLLAVAAISIIAVGAVPAWVAVMALAREAVVAVGFLVVAIAGGRRMNVRWVGKAATFALMCALPLFVAGHSTIGWHGAAEDLGWVCAVPALLLGWYAVATYVEPARHAMAEGRRERRDAR